MSYYSHGQGHGGYDAHAYAHAAYSQSGAAQGQHQAYSAGHDSSRATAAYSSSSASSAQAVYATHSSSSHRHHHHQQPVASSSSSSSNQRSSIKPKDKKSKRKNPTTLFEVEKQWAAENGQEGYPAEDWYSGGEGEWRMASVASSDRSRYVEPNFTAFTLAGGKSYLEDGTPSPLSSGGKRSSSNNGAGY